MVSSTVACSNLVQCEEEKIPDLICEVHLETSRQFVAFVFGIPLMVQIPGNL